MIESAEEAAAVQLSALPAPSTAMQNPVSGQDIEFSPLPALSILVGVDQPVPFQLSALPAPSTAMQNVVVGQETEENPLPPESTLD